MCLRARFCWYLDRSKKELLKYGGYLSYILFSLLTVNIDVVIYLQLNDGMGLMSFDLYVP